MIDCRKPYSFHFQLIDTYWKAPSSDYGPLHRITTLARKQGVCSIVVEAASQREDVREEIDDLDRSFGGGGAAEAIRMSFFSEEVGSNVDDADPLALIGQCTLVNYRPHGKAEFAVSFVFEAVFATPSNVRGTRRLLNHFVYAEAPLPVQVGGRCLYLKGVYYCQQNGETNVCAHACLRMAVNTIRGTTDGIRNRQINALLGGNGRQGMTTSKIQRVIQEVGGLYAEVIDCRDVSPANYVSILTAAAESRDMALLVFTTGKPAVAYDESDTATVEDEDQINHVVVAFGHTLNSDAWHPQAIPAYSGLPAARYCPSSAWVDHFVIHDDNFGPYFTLSSRALEIDPNVKAQRIIIVRKRPCTTKAHTAEAFASFILSNWIPSLPDLEEGGLWLNQVTQRKNGFVTRPILIELSSYIDHIRSVEAHDGSNGMSVPSSMFSRLPDYFWMVEFTLPDLFTGNRTKLGEVLIDPYCGPAGTSSSTPLVCGVRVPGLFLERMDEHGKFSITQHGINSHCAIYRAAPHDHEW